MRPESGTIIKGWAKNVRVALVFPDNYNIAMSSLAFQSLYGFINGIEGALCDRFVLDHKRSLERDFELSKYDIIIFTIPFVLNLLNVIRILSTNQISKEKSEKVICAGGIAVSTNPQGIAGYVDIAFTGSIEHHRSDIETIINLYRAGARKREISELIRNTEKKMSSIEEIVPPHTIVYTNLTEFANTHLVEIQRGCVGSCRFCLSRYINKRYIEFRYENIIRALDKCADGIRTIGLIGDAILAHSHIRDIVGYIIDTKRRPALASLRIQDLREDNIDLILKSDIKTLTIAPEVSTKRMMQLIGKRYELDKLLSMLSVLIKGGIRNIKLYMMIGLPGESNGDLVAIVDLIRQVRECLINSSRDKGRVGSLRVTINSFVPSPHTPMSDMCCDEIESLKEKQRNIKRLLSDIPNLEISFMDIYETLFQTALMRMDTSCADRLLYQENISLRKKFIHDKEFAGIVEDLCYGRGSTLKR